MNSQNREKITWNPLTSAFDMILDPEIGTSVKNVAKSVFFVKDGYTRTYPNLTIPVGMVITVDVGGELIV